MLDFLWRNNEYMLNPREAREVIAAMNKHRKEFPWCAWCGHEDGIEVHHILPVKAFPKLACDPQNLISLCGDGCHLIVGHFGNYQMYNPDVRIMCEQRRLCWSK